MGIINRDKNITEQKEWIQYNNDFGIGVSSLVQTGQTLILGGPMPFPGRLQSGLIFAQGVSGAPQFSLSMVRFVAGAGNTVITVGISNMVIQNASTSGPIGFSGLPIPGSTLLNFLAGDMFMVTTSVSNTAVSSLAVQLVVVKTQEIVSHNFINV
jgi:hypothetical protein